MNEVDYVFKIVVLGDSGVGKTSYIQRLINNNTPKGSTIGVDFAVHTILVDNKLIKVQIWDTAGQEQFRSITKSYFRNVAGALVFFDITEHQTYINLDSWIKDLLDNDVNEESIMCIANKTDLSPYRNCNAHQVYNSKIKILENSSKNINSPRNTFDIFINHIYNLYKMKIIYKGVTNYEPNKPQIKVSTNQESRCYCV